MAVAAKVVAVLPLCHVSSLQVWNLCPFFLDASLTSNLDVPICLPPTSALIVGDIFDMPEGVFVHSPKSA